MEPIEHTVHMLQNRLAELEQRMESPCEPGQPKEPDNRCAMRQSARNVLEQMIGQTKDKARCFQKLLAALPAELPPEADEALWEILCQYRNK